MISLLARFWVRLTERGFFGLGFGTGALISITLAHWLTYAQTETSFLNQWGGRLISLEANITQWLMLLFNIAAFVVLLNTLKVTRDVGKAQVAAYLHLDIDTVSIDAIDTEGKVKVTVHSRIVNSGNSPAFQARIGYDICNAAPGQVINKVYDIEKIGGISNPHPVIPGKSDQCYASLSKSIALVPDPKHRFIFMIEFNDVFGNLETTPLFSGTLRKSPIDDDSYVFVTDTITKNTPTET